VVLKVTLPSQTFEQLVPTTTGVTCKEQGEPWENVLDDKENKTKRKRLKSYKIVDIVLTWQKNEYDNSLIVIISSKDAMKSAE